MLDFMFLFLLGMRLRIDQMEFDEVVFKYGNESAPCVTPTEWYFFLCGCVYGICPFGVMDINRTALVMGIEDQYVLCDIIIVSVMGKCIWREGEVRL